MAEYRSKWSSRRKASGIFKPLLYLMIETIIMVLLCWFISFLDILPLTIVVALGIGYFWFTSSLKRYNKVIVRQKYDKRLDKDKK